MQTFLPQICKYQICVIFYPLILCTFRICQATKISPPHIAQTQICRCRICVKSTPQILCQQIFHPSYCTNLRMSDLCESTPQITQIWHLQICVKPTYHKSFTSKYFTPHITQIYRCWICVKPPSQKSCASNHLTLMLHKFANVRFVRNQVNISHLILHKFMNVRFVWNQPLRSRRFANIPQILYQQIFHPSYCTNLQVSDLWEANITQIYRIFSKSVQSESNP
jgi:hypothetical protein